MSTLRDSWGSSFLRSWGSCAIIRQENQVAPHTSHPRHWPRDTPEPTWSHFSAWAAEINVQGSEQGREEAVQDRKDEEIEKPAHQWQQLIDSLSPRASSASWGSLSLTLFIVYIFCLTGSSEKANGTGFKSLLAWTLLYWLLELGRAGITENIDCPGGIQMCGMGKWART